MVKRKRDEVVEQARTTFSAKRTRTLGKQRLLDLSDELILRVLSLLSVADLTSSERVCRKFQRLSIDNEIWREKFYNHFVRPRARRIPGLKESIEGGQDHQTLYYSSKSAKWLEYGQSLRGAPETDWKRRYKVKLNWSKGRCRASEVDVCSPKSPVKVKVHDGTIYTIDGKDGLKAWSQRSRPQLLHSYRWSSQQTPTALTTDARGGDTAVVVGLEDGSIDVFRIDLQKGFEIELQKPSASHSAVTNIASSWPYVLTMSANQRITLYETDSAQPRFKLLAELHSSTFLDPASLSIRRLSNSTLIASVVYSYSRLNAGWSLGLQEIRLNLAGDIIKSRLTSTIDTPQRDFPFRDLSRISSRSASTAPFALHPQLMNPPTSLSHSGCYILAGLPDNTLMVYTVISNDEKLEINSGRRLWGHTSSVSGAEVSDRGKALSVSAKGDEVRVWELEDILSSYTLRKTSTQLQPQYSSDSIDTALIKRGNGLGLALKEMKPELGWLRHWVGFDDEQVVVLGERDQRQILSCYDFA